MLIQSTLVSVSYERIRDIKKVYYLNEDILKEFFTVATVLPVPDEAPDEIPRIVLKTLHEHAQLSITPITTTFEISHYDNGFEKNWANCSYYISERMNKVFDFLNILTNNSYKYIGVVSNVIYDEVKQEGARKLINVLLKSENIKDIYDINIRYTFVEKERLFVNILLQNARLFNRNNVINEAGALQLCNQTGESIGAVIDINDRYGFNNQIGYCSNAEVLEELLCSMDTVIENKLLSLIEKGTY